MTLHIRRAAIADARAMSALLNAIISKGGTTAKVVPVPASELAEWINNGGDDAAWHLAETDLGEVLGFQWIAPRDDLPPEACDIATFVKLGQTGLGIGSRLFDATRAAAKALGYVWINATIRSDNESGLTYYQSRGFETYRTDPDARLADGRRVGKVSKRYDLV